MEHDTAGKEDKVVGSSIIYFNKLRKMYRNEYNINIQIYIKLAEMVKDCRQMTTPPPYESTP